jgi:pSer/pThr/pTyr-binding forkhead associated (FHA) protein
MKKCIRCGEDNLDDAKFCDICGAPFQEAPKKKPTINVKAPKVVLVAIESGKVFELQPDEEMLVGRGEPDGHGIVPQIRLEDEDAVTDGVSRVHAKIICFANEYYILDLDSTNSTYLNKQKLVPQTQSKLSDGDEIQLGRYLMRIRFL